MRFAGLLRERLGAARTPAAAAPGLGDDVEMRDGLHGLLVWGLATLITVFLLLIAASASTRPAAPWRSPPGRRCSADTC